MDEINISASQKGESKNGQLTCPPIIGPQVKLFFRGKTLYIGGEFNGQETLHPRADN